MHTLIAIGTAILLVALGMICGIPLGIKWATELNAQDDAQLGLDPERVDSMSLNQWTSIPDRIGADEYLQGMRG